MSPLKHFDVNSYVKTTNFEQKILYQKKEILKLFEVILIF